MLHVVLLLHRTMPQSLHAIGQAHSHRGHMYGMPGAIPIMGMPM